MSAAQFWKTEWEKQQRRAEGYNAAVEEFVVREMAEKDSKSRSQEWKESFDVVVGTMEEWAARMREILRVEGVRELVARGEMGEEEGETAGKKV